MTVKSFIRFALNSSIFCILVLLASQEIHFRCLWLYSWWIVIYQSSWSTGISRQNQNNRTHAVTACIGLWCHGAMHAACACIVLWCACIRLWCHRSMHALTAWDLSFKFVLKLYSSYFGYIPMSFSLKWAKAERNIHFCSNTAVSFLTMRWHKINWK